MPMLGSDKSGDIVCPINDIVKKISEGLIKNAEGAITIDIIKVHDLTCEVHFTKNKSLEEKELSKVIHKNITETIYRAVSIKNPSFDDIKDTANTDVYLSDNSNKAVYFEGQIRGKSAKRYWD